MSFLKKSVNLHVFFDELEIVLEINKLVKRFESLSKCRLKETGIRKSVFGKVILVYSIAPGNSFFLNQV